MKKGFLFLFTLIVLTFTLAFSAQAIPLAELGRQADQQQAPLVPALDHGTATLNAPLQAMRGRIGPEGLNVESTSATKGGGVFRLVPTRLDAGGVAAMIPSGTVSTHDRKVILDRGPVREIFTASTDGLRQDFIVHSRPAGTGDLILTLDLSGAAARQSGEAVTLTLPGRRELLYHGLKVTDANGKELVATLTSRDAHTLAITVRDTGAGYPITIDPTISDADWQAWNPGLPGSNALINALAVSSDGTHLYAGGGFTTIGTVAANYIAQWDGSSWSPLGSGVGGYVYALTVSGSTLYVGGAFTTAGNRGGRSSHVHLH